MLTGDSHIEHLCRRVMDTPPSLCHARAALVTRRYERDGSRYAPILLRAHALADVLEGMTILSLLCIEQVDHFCRLIVEGDNVLDALHGEQAPNPLVSLLVDDCMGRGQAYEQGGAVHNYTSPNVVGLANVADALMAIRHAVYRERLIGMEELLEALERDFAGYEDLRQLLLSQAPKYGNDDPEVDRIAHDVASYVLRRFKRHRNVRGGTFEAGLQSISAHALFQGAVPATPDGRTRETLAGRRR